MTVMAACPACASAPLASEMALRSLEPDFLFSLPSIHCAACIGKVERALSRLPGVLDARVNLSLKRVAVRAEGIQPETLVMALKDAGFDAYRLDARVLHARRDDTGRALLTRLAVAGFAMMNVMLFSVAIWSGAADATRGLFHLLSAMISLPAVLYCGQPFFANARTALRARSLNMDVPISLAILLAAGLSLFESLNGGAHAYFDAALSLTFFLLIGRYLDHRTRGSAQSAARELAALEVQTAQRLDYGVVTSVRVSAVSAGDCLLIASGARLPVDGILQSPAGLVDRSFVTGESDPVSLVLGASVQAGEINVGAPFEVRVTAAGENTTLRRIAALVEMAENSRNSYTNLADRAARIYAPTVHLLALAAFAIWLWISGDIRLALNIAVAVLIITCPCALGLAVPAVTTAAIARLYRMGYLVKSGTALERLAEVDVVIFDKTGTLTLSRGSHPFDHLSPVQASIARTLAQASDHPVSRAIAAALPPGPRAPLSDIVEVPGCGMQGRLDDRQVRLGNGRWLGFDTSGPALQLGTETPVQLPLTEVLRPGVEAALAGLRAQGVSCRILSGDRHDLVARLAKDLGIEDPMAEITATEKHDYLRALQRDGHKVLMVGDGLNDTAALAAANASVAPSSALDASRNAADVVLLRDSLTEFPLLMSIARATTRLSRQNFAIAAAYNAIAIPVAFLGYATPLLAAIAMSASSLSVLLNAMRIRYVS